MEEPLYAKGLKFKALREICKMSGYDVIFEDVEKFDSENMAAYTIKNQKFLYLPNIDGYFDNSVIDECVALGHELGHHMLFYSYDDYYSKNDEEIENECTKIGFMLSKLANLIVENNKERVVLDFEREKKCRVHGFFLPGLLKSFSEIQRALIDDAEVESDYTGDYTIVSFNNNIALLEKFWNGKVYTNGINIETNELTNKIYEPVYYDKVKKEIIGFGEI